MHRKRQRRTTTGERLRIAGLFAGIGGIELGLQKAGHRIEVLCEIDSGARRVLKTHFKDVPVEQDVAELETLPDVDLVAAGFPCQDLSQAGQTAGIKGKQSGLIGHLFHLLKMAKPGPRWVLIENVPFMLHLHHGDAMRYLVRHLESLGFAWAYRVIDTRAFGLPQRRRRVFLLASRTHDPRPVLLDQYWGQLPSSCRSDGACGFYWTEGNNGLGWAEDAVPPLKGGSGTGIPSPPAIWLKQESALAAAVGYQIVVPSIEVAERLQGFRAGWTAPAVDDVSRRKGPRWRLVGNAVSVPVAQWIGDRLLVAGDRRLEAKVIPDAIEIDLNSQCTLPNAAWGGQGKACRSDVSPWPARGRYRHLAAFLKPSALQPLSLAATKGFYARLRRSTIRRDEAFDEALREHAARMEQRASGGTLELLSSLRTRVLDVDEDTTERLAV